MKLLLIEDDPHIAQALVHALLASYVVDRADNGAAGLLKASLYSYQAIVLDLNLPDVPGLQVCQLLRKDGFSGPIVILSAETKVISKISLLDAGADDYLTKPFSFDVLLARLRSVMRRSSQPPSSTLAADNLILDPASRTVTREGTQLNLTATEFRVLEFLMRRAGHAVSRSAIIEGVWGFEEDVEDNTVDVFIRHLREKIDLGRERKLIHTVRGYGYILRDEP